MAKIADPVLDPIRPGTDPPELDPRARRRPNPPGAGGGTVYGDPRTGIGPPPGNPRPRRPVPPGQGSGKMKIGLPRNPTTPRRKPVKYVEPKGPPRFGLPVEPPRNPGGLSYKKVPDGALPAEPRDDDPIASTMPVKSPGNYVSTASPNVSQRRGMTDYSSPIHPSSSRRRGS